MSGLPTANDIVAGLKRRYYRQEESVEITLRDMQNEGVVTRVQSFMDARGFPAQWSAEEYSGYFDKIFGADKERQRNYLLGILAEDKVTLTVGNRVMAAMLAGGYMKALFTTNFDSVVERAVAEVSSRSLNAYNLEGSRSALQALNNDEFPLYVKMHGDFRHDSIKNLTADLVSQDKELSTCMTAAATRFGLIVAGYSGRDDSVMALLRTALDQTNSFPAGLFWTNIKGAKILPAVEELIEAAKTKGIRAGIIDIETFDTLMLRLWRNIDNKPPDLDAKVRRSTAVGATIPLPAKGSSRPLLRLNALPIEELPRKALKVETNRAFEWSELREIQRKLGRGVVITKGESIFAWGNNTQIQQAFGHAVKSVAEADLPDTSSASVNHYIHGFLEEALAECLARGRPLIARTNRRGSILIADRHARDNSMLAPVKRQTQELFGPIPRLKTVPTDEHPKSEPLYWAESLRISLSWKQDQPWLLIDPDIWVWPPHGREVATDFLSRKKAKRYNNFYDGLLSSWIEVLFGPEENSPMKRFSLLFSDNTNHETADNPVFTIRRKTGFSWRLTA